MVRTFLAIDLPLSLKKKLFSLKKDLEPQKAKIKWVEEENFHLTLFFFGELKEKEVKKVIKICEENLGVFPPFELQLTDVSGFPKEDRPRVVFIGCEERTSLLEKLIQTLGQAFKKGGFKLEDRKFHPHITLFRVKHLTDERAYQSYLSDLKESAKKLKGEVFKVAELTLFASELSSHGPTYLPLKTFSLGGKA